MLNTGWAVLIIISLFQNEMRGKVTELFSNSFLPQKNLPQKKDKYRFSKNF
jgi:hypothetical protein